MDDDSLSRLERKFGYENSEIKNFVKGRIGYAVRTSLGAIRFITSAGITSLNWGIGFGIQTVATALKMSIVGFLVGWAISSTAGAPLSFASTYFLLKSFLKKCIEVRVEVTNKISRRAIFEEILIPHEERIAEEAERAPTAGANELNQN